MRQRILSSISSKPSNNNLPLVSVVVPMRNEEAQAEACLESLAALTYEPIEFVLVDDRSSDKTTHLIEQFCVQDPRCKLLTLKEEPPLGWSGKAHAADVGIRASRGELIIVADADVRHAPQSAARTVRQLEGREFIIGLPKAGGQGISAWCARYLYELLFIASDREQGFAFGAYAAFTRALYERLGGWGHAPGHPEVLALADRARRLGVYPFLLRRDDLYMEQYATLGAASQALMRNTNYRFMPSRAVLRVAAILTWCWVGASLIWQSPLIGGLMLLCYCGLMGYAWRRYGTLAVFGGFCFALPGALWFTAVSLFSMVWQALGGRVRWRGRSFVR
jgi:chlorobactene glucosyltransferase